MIKFSKKITLKINSLQRRIRNYRGKIPTKGLPEGIAFETLNEICHQHLGEGLRSTSYVNISGGGGSGSYRLLLTTEKGQRWGMIYKNALYRLDHLPALAELPMNPGPPEYFIYSNIKGDLAKYLPSVYLCMEVDPGLHYRYLLEDVGKVYRRPQSSEILSFVLPELFDFHCAMSEWALNVDQDHLLQYNYENSIAIQEYILKNIERYVKSTSSHFVSEMYKLWSNISKIHLRKEFYELKITRPVHGDFRCANILIHRKNPKKIKVIDWEWAGLSVPHTDLAALFNRASSVTEEKAISNYGKKDSQFSLEDHRRLYQWCKLKRSLLEVAYSCTKEGYQDDKTRKRHDRFIELLSLRVLQAYQELV